MTTEPAGRNAHHDTHHWQHEMFGTITAIGTHQDMVARGWIAISADDYARILAAIKEGRPTESPYQRDTRERLERRERAEAIDRERFMDAYGHMLERIAIAQRLATS
jgi:hypothetical protein